MTDARSFNERIIDEFRANAGRVGGPFEGAPMVLLTTTGAKSGEARTTPLVCLEDASGRVFVFASNGGRANHPGWFHNVLAHPAVTVERGTERYAAIATPLAGDERDAVFARHVATWPVFGEYQDGLERSIPVVELRRA